MGEAMDNSDDAPFTWLAVTTLLHSLPRAFRHVASRFTEEEVARRLAAIVLELMADYLEDQFPESQAEFVVLTHELANSSGEMQISSFCIFMHRCSQSKPSAAEHEHDIAAGLFWEAHARLATAILGAQSSPFEEVFDSLWERLELPIRLPDETRAQLVSRWAIKTQQLWVAACVSGLDAASQQRFAQMTALGQLVPAEIEIFFQENVPDVEEIITRVFEEQLEAFRSEVSGLAQRIRDGLDADLNERYPEKLREFAGVLSAALHEVTSDSASPSRLADSTKALLDWLEQDLDTLRRSTLGLTEISEIDIELSVVTLWRAVDASSRYSEQ